MVIDKIGNINNIVETKKTRASAQPRETKKNDSIQISSEGRQAAEISRYSQAVNDAPDIRMDRVKEIKDRIASGAYNFNDENIIGAVADKIARFLTR
jgi:negative regulator of flagellin synthesis FlgM